MIRYLHYNSKLLTFKNIIQSHKYYDITLYDNK